MEELLDLLDQYADAKRELDKCREGCEYDAGYYCDYQYRTVERIKQKFSEALTAIIDERISVVLQRAVLVR